MWLSTRYPGAINDPSGNEGGPPGRHSVPGDASDFGARASVSATTCPAVMAASAFALAWAVWAFNRVTWGVLSSGGPQGGGRGGFLGRLRESDSVGYRVDVGGPGR